MKSYLALADSTLLAALISIESNKRCFSQKTKAIMRAHFYVPSSQHESLAQRCEERNINCTLSHLTQLQAKENSG